MKRFLILLILTSTAFTFNALAQKLTSFYATGSGYGYKNEKGDTVIAPVYDSGPYQVKINDKFWIRKNGKYGMLEGSGKVVVDFVFDHVIHERFLTITQINSKSTKLYGGVNKLGITVFEPIYDEIIPEGEYFILSKDGKMGVSHYSGKKVCELKYEMIFKYFDKKLIKVRNNNLYGYIDYSGNEVIAPKYDTLSGITEKRVIFRQDAKYGLLDLKGKVVLPAKYDLIYNFSKGSTVVVLNKKYGFIDANGKEILPLNYDYANHFMDDNRAVAEADSKVFLIDKKGKRYIEGLYDFIENYNEDYILVGKYDSFGRDYENLRFGLIGEKFNTLLPCEFEEEIYTYDFDYQGLLMAKKNGKYALFNREFKQLTDFVFDEIIDLYQFMNCGIASAKINGSYYLISVDGRIMTEKGYAEIANTEELCYIKVVPTYENGKQGMLGIDGKEIIPCIYNYIENVNYYNPDLPDYKEEKPIYFIVSTNIKSGLYDIKGRMILDTIYDSPFNELNYKPFGPWVLRIGDKYGIADTSGKALLPFDYDGIELYGEDFIPFYILQKEGKYGFYNFNEKVFTPCIFDEVNLGNFIEGQYFTDFSIDGKYGLINQVGKIIIDPSYSQIDTYLYLKLGFIVVWEDDLMGLKDNTGKTILECSYHGFDIKPRKGFKAVIILSDGNEILLDNENNIIK